MKACELMVAAANNPETYKGKRYAVYYGDAINYSGEKIEIFRISCSTRSSGKFVSNNNDIVYINNETRVVEIPSC